MGLKKVLIFHDINNLKPSGGPAGYLYNMKIGLDLKEINNIKFIDTDIDKQKNKIFKKARSYIPKKVKKMVENLMLLSKIILNRTNPQVDLSKYDVVHFHSTLSLYFNLKTIHDYKGLVLLTSHCPKPWHREFMEDDLMCVEKIFYMPFFYILKKVDEIAFRRADYIVFPCKEAEEPYVNNWKNYQYIKELKKDRYKYVPTGIRELKVSVEKELVLKKYNIPLGSFVISYIGRHNKTKGYDILKNIGNKILKKYDNIYFLIAGNEAPIKKLMHKNWIEIGWTNDPYSIIKSSDVFILPNKETYFDMIMLEVLSLSKIVIASYTGGNKYFQKFENSSINFFKNESEAIYEIEKFLNYNKNEIEVEGNKNYLLYTNEFTIDHFISKYLNMIDDL